MWLDITNFYIHFPKKEQNRESINCNDDLVRAIRKTEPSHSQLKVRVILENE